MEKHCLSIQSHVVHGYVGNKCAVFPLQLHGFDVSPINSVQLSTHTGYTNIRGQRLGGEELLALIDGLKCNGLLGLYSHICTGYIATESFLRIVADVVAQIRLVHPDAVYVCDPVLGDDGKLYVPEALVPIYRSLLVPLATILTPNQFEAESLTGLTITDVHSAVRAMRALHCMGARTVVITSSTCLQRVGQGPQINTAEGVIDGGGNADRSALEGSMLLLASCPWEDVADECHPGGIFPPQPVKQPSAVFSVTIPRLPASFTGTGDLTAALLLANSSAHPHNFVSAVESTVTSLQCVCMRTLDRAKRLATEAAQARTLLSAGEAAHATTSEEQLTRARALVQASELGVGRSGDGVVQPFSELRLVECASQLVNPEVPPNLRARAVNLPLDKPPFA